MVLGCEHNVEYSFFFPATHLCMIVRGKQALDIQWNLALWGNSVWSSYMQGHFQFSLFTKGNQVFRCSAFCWRGKSQAFFTIISRLARNKSCCSCLGSFNLHVFSHLDKPPLPQKNNKKYMHSTSEMDTINWFCCEYSQPLLGAYYVVLQNTLVWVWRIGVIALYFTPTFLWPVMERSSMPAKGSGHYWT